MSGSGRPERTVTSRRAVRNSCGEMPSIWSSCMMVVKRGGHSLVRTSCSLDFETRSRRSAGDPLTQRLFARQRREKARQGGERGRVQIDLSGLFLDRDRGRVRRRAFGTATEI